MSYIAIIDCGTNTFNLGIFTVHPEISFVYTKKIPVKIGAALDKKKMIDEDACIRSLEAMKKLRHIIDKFSCQKIFAVGTSAFRDSQNGKELAVRIYKETGIFIEIIDGNREAELIAAGIRSVMKNILHTSLILDIGGGSNECILINYTGILWKKSYPLGIGRLLGEKPHSDPILKEEIEYYEKLFIKEMEETWMMCKKFKPLQFVGASGAFDSIWEMAEAGHFISQRDNISENTNAGWVEIPVEVFYKLYEKIIVSTMEERSRFKGLVPMRKDMIVLSVILMDVVFRYSGAEKIICCKASLKEGILLEKLNM